MTFYLEDSKDWEGNRIACYIHPATGFITPRIVIDVPHDVSPRDAITIAKAILDAATEVYRTYAERTERQTAEMMKRLESPHTDSNVCGMWTGQPPRVRCTFIKGHKGPHES